MRLTALFVLAASLASVMADAIAVENDIKYKLGPQTSALLRDVNEYPASGLSGALAIHTDLQALTDVFNNAISDVKSSSPFSEADGTEILEDMASLVADVSNTLSAIENQAAAWTNVPGGQALVVNDLKDLGASTIAFVDAIAAALPDDLVAETASIRTQFVGGFESAIAAYSP